MLNKKLFVLKLLKYLRSRNLDYLSECLVYTGR